MRKSPCRDMESLRANNKHEKNVRLVLHAVVIASVSSTVAIS